MLGEIQETNAQIGLFGATVEFQETFNQKTRAIGDAICKELGISLEEINNSPILRKAKTDETAQFTSKEVEDAYADFYAWYKEHIDN